MERLALPFDKFSIAREWFYAKSHFGNIDKTTLDLPTMDLLINLDGQSSTPLQRQLYDALREAILGGRLVPGQKLPASRDLARSLGVSRTTVTLTYESLLTEGYLEAQTGAGTFVGRSLPDDLLRPASGPLRSGHRKQPAQSSAPKSPGKRLSKFGQYLKSNEPMGPPEEPPIQFSFGRPDIDEFPMRQWLQLLNHHAKQRNLSLLELPKKSKGYLPLREAIAGYLARARAVKADPEQIIIVNGSQQALDLVARVMIEHGDKVAIEDPCFLGAKTIFEANGAKLCPLPVDENGIVLDQLREDTMPAVKLIYVTPSHQFPMGVSLCLPRRLELLSWAQRTGTYVIEDDYDSEFRYCGRPVPALAGLDQSESVIYVGTFSKTLFVSLRLGYLLVPRSLAGIFAHAKWVTDRHSPVLEQQVLADFITSGQYERHIRRMRALYERRRAIMLESLREHFGDNCKIFGENSGIHVLVRFRTKMSGSEISQAALEKGVLALPAIYMTEPQTADMVLCYGGVKDENIRAGIRLLSQVIQIDS